MTPRMLRGVAVVIAIAAVVDPAITTARRVRPEVALVVVDPARDGALAGRVARALRDDFRVLRAPFAGAAASVVVGRALPPGAARLAEPVFVVAPDRDDPQVRFEAVEVPARAPLDAAVTIEADVRVTGSSGPLEVALHAGGATVDRIVRAAGDADGEGLHRVRLTFVPAAPGSVPLRLTATVAGETGAADAVVEVLERRWSVLFHDTRPSWQSTFVRRALARDARFDVALRVVTSRDASIGAGAAPIGLRDAGALMTFDAIVVGAPEGLSDTDVTALEHYLRRRGGSVVLLADNDVEGPYDRLTAVSAWTMSRAPDAAAIADDAGGDTLRAFELRWPRALPAGATPIAHDPAGNAVLWGAPVGAGRLLVSGALDAWRLRDPAVSGFGAFWRALIADAAAASPPALDAWLTQAVLRPGESTDLMVTLRDLALAELAPGTNLEANVAAALEGPNGTRALRVLPEEAPGRLRAEVRAPETPGLYRVRVSSGAAETLIALRVTADPAHAAPDRSDLLVSWAAARGGAMLSASATRALPAMLAGTLPAVRRRETWHPLRSAWWIVPFALALGAEWWWRRRRGYA